jgi:hypothetical protein
VNGTFLSLLDLLELMSGLAMAFPQVQHHDPFPLDFSSSADHYSKSFAVSQETAIEL